MTGIDVDAYAVGPCSASVCAPRGVDVEDVEREVNRQHPTGISSQWTFAADEAHFSGGEPNPCPCNVYPESRVHYLLHC